MLFIHPIHSVLPVYSLLELVILVSLPSVKVINDYKTLFSSLPISSAPCHLYISPNIPVSLKNHIIFFTSQSFPSIVLMSTWIFCFLLLSLHWGSLVGNVLLLDSGFHMLHFCILVSGYFSTSNVRGLV